MADTKLILHVKGTEETTSLPKPAVRAAIAQGQISYSQLIWSPIHNAWKQVRELPHLWPSQKLAPAPPPRPIAAPAAPAVRVAPATPVPKVQAHPKVAAAQTPRIASPPKVTVPAAHPRIAAQPKIAAAGAAVPVARARGHVTAAGGVGETVPEEDTSLHIARWACFIVGGLLLVALVLNYFLVDQPLRSRFAQTPFAQVSVHAHLGAFVQPNALVIHVLGASPAVNPASFSAFLVSLAQSTPSRPGGDAFDRVSLTPGWTGRYSFAGLDWQELGKMGADSPDKQRQFILDQMASASGQQLVGPDASAETRDQVWAAFESAFTHQAPTQDRPTSSPTDTNPSAQ
jgi:hypothetical protein